MAPNSQVFHILLLFVGALPAGVGFTRPGSLEVVSSLPPGASFDVLVQSARGGDALARITSGSETEAVRLVPAVRLPGFRAYRLSSPMRISDSGPIRPGDGLLRAGPGDTLILEAEGRRAECVVRNPAISADTSRDSE